MYQVLPGLSRGRPRLCDEFCSALPLFFRPRENFGGSDQTDCRKGVKIRDGTNFGFTIPPSFPARDAENATLSGPHSRLPPRSVLLRPRGVQFSHCDSNTIFEQVATLSSCRTGTISCPGRQDMEEAPLCRGVAIPPRDSGKRPTSKTFSHRG